MPLHVQELFGGRSLPLLDGEAHRARKKIVKEHGSDAVGSEVFRSLATMALSHMLADATLPAEPCCALRAWLNNGCRNT